MSAKNLNKLFNNRIFRIPDYQRGYAWVDKQLNEFWDDLDEITEKNGKLKRHYMGTVYLEETNPKESEKWLSGTKFYNVIDGQQRLTTISILLFELLKATETGYVERKKETLLETFIAQSNLSGENKVYKFSYAINSQNYKFLLRSIFEDPKIILDRENAGNYYTENLSFAKNFFETKIKELNNEEKNLLFKKITTALQFDIREIKEDLDVQAVFETMNNRGKPLSILEKLKNRLIYLTERLANTRQEDRVLLRDMINKSWSKIYISLGQNPKYNLDEDEFLSAHLSLYSSPTVLEGALSEEAAEEQIFRMFCNKPEKYANYFVPSSHARYSKVTFEKIENYIISLSELAPIWFQIHNSSSRLVKQILTLRPTKEIKIFLAAILNQIHDKMEVDTTFSKLEKILFRNLVTEISIIDEKLYAHWAGIIYKNQEWDLGLFRDSLTIEERIHSINRHQDKYINIGVNASNVIRSFGDLFTYARGKRGFYRWKILKYFLFEYEEFLRNEYQEDTFKVNFDSYDETTIEHILPVELEKNWNDTMQSFLKNLDEQQKIEQAEKVLINSLGNLTILKGGKNSSLGNKSWEEKKERYKTGSYNEIEISQNEVWTEVEIAKRGAKMLRFLETKVDGLKFSKEDIKRALFYDDYIIKLVYKN